MKIVHHVPRWEPAQLPIDTAGNTVPGYRCAHMLENGRGQCESTVFQVDHATGDHSCVVDDAS